MKRKLLFRIWKTKSLVTYVQINFVKKKKFFLSLKPCKLKFEVSVYDNSFQNKVILQ